MLACHSLSAVQHPPADFARLQRFIDVYRHLLNGWQLWRVRARFDVDKAFLFQSAVLLSPSTASPTAKSLLLKLQAKPPPQVYARCNYCQHALSLDRLATTTSSKRKPFMPRGKLGAAKAAKAAAAAAAASPTAAAAVASSAARAVSYRIRACPHCKKSLPRCALCLMNLDCATPNAGGGGGGGSSGGFVSDAGGLGDGSGGGGGALTADGRDALADTSSSCAVEGWFSWCQTCRHGGHAEHMSQWFAKHAQCPVSDCECRCADNDYMRARV
jgi:hypothetical protein